MPLITSNDTNDGNAASTPLCHIVTPVGMLGYGLNEDETTDALRRLVPTGVPTAIILDSGSTDSGPDKLAQGIMGSPRTMYARDLRKLVKLVHEFRVPLLFSSAGGDGVDAHVREITAVIEEIASEAGNEAYALKTIGIFANIDKAVIKQRLAAGRVSGCGTCVPQLTEDDVDAAPWVVAQMGPEPFVDAMRANPDFDVVVGGRAYDPAPYVAYCAYVSGAKAEDWGSPETQRIFGGFTHMGKILECGGTCAEPKSHGAIATVYRDGGFVISPLTPSARCTPVSVAAHTMYEKTRPDILHGPGGYLDLNTATYEQLEDNRSIRVAGSTFHFSQESGRPYQLKLEAGCIIGYRSMFLGSIRDPILIQQFDSLTKLVKGYVKSQHSHVTVDWDFDFHVYGKPEGGADNALVTQEQQQQANELFIIGEALAPTQELATSIAATARIAVIHGSYPGQKATAGNFAFGIGGKTVIELGPCSKFCVYHLMDLDEGEEHLTVSDDSGKKLLFKQNVSLIGKGDRSSRAAAAAAAPVLLSPPTATTTTTAADAAAAAPANGNAAATNGNGANKPNGEKLAATSPSQSPPKTLGDLAKVVRSKNSGPYEITLDLIFESRSTYLQVRKSGLLSTRAVAAAYGIAEADVIWCGFFDPAQAFKATIPRTTREGRRVAGGSFMENDVHGSQKHLPLVRLRLPRELVEALG